MCMEIMVDEKTEGKNRDMINDMNNVCLLVENVCESLAKAKMKKEDLSDEERSDIRKVSEFFKVTENAGIALCLSVQEYYANYHRQVSLQRIQKTVGCKPLRLLQFKDGFDELLRKGYLSENKPWEAADDDDDDDEDDYGETFSVDSSVIKSIQNGRFVRPKHKKAHTDVYAFLEAVGSLARSAMYENNRRKYSSGIFYNMDKIEKYYLPSVPCLKAVKSLLKNESDRYLFYLVCKDYLAFDDCELVSSLNLLGLGKKGSIDMADDIISGKNDITGKDLVEVYGADVIDEAELALTDKGKEVMLGEDAYVFDRRRNEKGNDMIRFSEIPSKTMRYSSDNARQVAKLTEYLEEVNFTKLRERMKSQGLSGGFCCLFHGGPGTGKTESALQIARITGRDIMKVDMSQIKDKWVGESEKNIKKLFRRYDEACKSATSHRKPLPILLFNEADAVFSKRVDIASSGNPTVAQMENAIQNIILDEMESMDGILIATTNLSVNFDPAFERRFLYKIKFDSPDLDARKAIWRDRMDWLDDCELESLASDFDLSGGQIDNVSRKALMSHVLTGDHVCMDELRTYCKEERFDDEFDFSSAIL